MVPAFNRCTVGFIVKFRHTIHKFCQSFSIEKSIESIYHAYTDTHTQKHIQPVYVDDSLSFFVSILFKRDLLAGSSYFQNWQTLILHGAFYCMHIANTLIYSRNLCFSSFRISKQKLFNFGCFVHFFLTFVFRLDFIFHILNFHRILRIIST